MQTLILLTRDTARIDPQILRDALNARSLQKFGRPPPSLDNTTRLETRGGMVTVTRLNRPFDDPDVDLVLADCSPTEIDRLAQHRRHLIIEADFDDPNSESMTVWAATHSIGNLIDIDLVWNPQDHVLQSLPSPVQAQRTTPAPTVPQNSETPKDNVESGSRIDRFLRSVGSIFPDSDQRKQQRKVGPTLILFYSAALAIGGFWSLDAGLMVALFGTGLAMQYYGSGLSNLGKRMQLLGVMVILGLLYYGSLLDFDRAKMLNVTNTLSVSELLQGGPISPDIF